MQQSEQSDKEPTSPPDQIAKIEMLPGFRFHPTEQELVGFYLKRMVEGKRIACDFIPKVDLYRYDPWELKGMARTLEKEWFFFVPRDSKYPNGGRPNRRTQCGYWKATGTDKTVHLAPNHSIMSHNCYGLRKTLVYYKGRAPKGTKTEWIMNEYRLCYTHDCNGNHSTKENLQSLVTLCRVYRKSVPVGPIQKQGSESSTGAVEWPMMSKPCVKLEEFDHNYAINHFTKPPPFSSQSSSSHGGAAHAGLMMEAALVNYQQQQQEVISGGPRIISNYKSSLSTSRSLLNQNWAAKSCVQLSPTSSCVTIANREDYQVINQTSAGINQPAGCSENKLQQSEFARAAAADDHDMEIELWSDY